jgi:hypothetical protein
LVGNLKNSGSKIWELKIELVVFREVNSDLGMATQALSGESQNFQIETPLTDLVSTGHRVIDQTKFGYPHSTLAHLRDLVKSTINE